jgi:hypothetical protein
LSGRMRSEVGELGSREIVQRFDVRVLGVCGCT